MATTGPTPDSRRDFQRAKLYHAENLVLRMFDRAADFPVVQVAGSSLTLPVERRFASIESTQHYADRVLELGWVRRRWPGARASVVVRRRDGAGRAHYEPATTTAPAVIAVPTHVGNTAWALRELVVLHELSHHLTQTDGPAHGPAFAGTLIELGEGVIGPEAAFLLRVCFADAGVRVA